MALFSTTVTKATGYKYGLLSGSQTILFNSTKIHSLQTYDTTKSKFAYLIDPRQDKEAKTVVFSSDPVGTISGYVDEAYANELIEINYYPNGNINLDTISLYVNVSDISIGIEYDSYTLLYIQSYEGETRMVISDTVAELVTSSMAFLAVIFDMGQSNSGGRAIAERLDCSTYSPTPTSSYIYNKTDYSDTDNGNWEATEAGVNTSDSDINTTYNYFGAEISLQQKIYDRLKSNSYYIKCSDGSTSLAISWNVNTVDGLFDKATQNFYDVAISKLALLHPTKAIRIVAILWHQGEADATDQDKIDAYAVNLEAFINGVRGYATPLNNAPFIITKLNFAQNAAEATINTIFDNAASTMSDVYTIDISDLPQKRELTTEEKCSVVPPLSDDRHASYLAQIGKGERIFNKIVELGRI